MLVCLSTLRRVVWSTRGRPGACIILLHPVVVCPSPSIHPVSNVLLAALLAREQSAPDPASAALASSALAGLFNSLAQPAEGEAGAARWQVLVRPLLLLQAFFAQVRACIHVCAVVHKCVCVGGGLLVVQPVGGEQGVARWQGLVQPRLHYRLSFHF